MDITLLPLLWECTVLEREGSKLLTSSTDLLVVVDPVGE